MRNFVPVTVEIRPSQVPSRARTVLVNGGSGFLGSHLCEALLERGCLVTCLDNFSTGRRHNIAHLVTNRNFRVVNFDVRDPLDIEASFISTGCSSASRWIGEVV